MRLLTVLKPPFSWMTIWLPPLGPRNVPEVTLVPADRAFMLTERPEMEPIDPLLFKTGLTPTTKGPAPILIGMFAFVLAYVVFSCVESRRDVPNSVWHLTIGIAVVAGTVDFAALFGGWYLVSQVIAGAFTGIAFLTFGSAGR